jgi:hypothetical protein
MRELNLVTKYAGKIESIQTISRSLGINAKLNSIIEACATQLNLPQDEVREVLDGLQNLYALMSRFSLKPNEFCSVISKSIEAQAPEATKKELFKAWNDASFKICKALESMGPDEPIAVNQKAKRLSFSHQNVLLESNLITDVRPVFSATGDNILRYLVTHMLLLEFQSGDQIKRLELAIDSDDLTRLAEVCERAKLKTSTIQKALKTQDAPTIIVSEKGDG